MVRGHVGVGAVLAVTSPVWQGSGDTSPVRIDRRRVRREQVREE
jgi:hypothetical protein